MESEDFSHFYFFKELFEVYIEIRFRLMVGQGYGCVVKIRIERWEWVMSMTVLTCLERCVCWFVSMVAQDHGVQKSPLLYILTRCMSSDVNVCLWFEVYLHACVYVNKYLWWDAEGVQSGISFAVMTHSGGIPQPLRQNSSCSGHNTDYALV